jgi:hypothetical protein
MSECRRETIAKGPGSAVERCTCGSIHLTIGAMTVRLQESDFAHVATTVTKAGARLAGVEAGRASPAPGGRLGRYLEN